MVSARNIFTCNFTNPDNDILTQLVWNKNAAYVIAYYPRNDPDVSYNTSYGKPGDYIMSKPDLFAAQGSSDLTVTSVSLDDAGVFNCEARQLGPTIKDGVTLDVYVPVPAERSVTVVANPSSSPATDSSVSIRCVVSMEATDSLLALRWQYGDFLSGASQIASWDYLNGISYGDNYSGDTYPINADDITNGIAVFTINSVQLADDGRHWCEAVTTGGSVSSSVAINVIEFPPKTTTENPLTSWMQSTTLEYKTSDIIAYVEVIRVESHLIEIGWESFDMDVIDVDEYRVFYSASLSESRNDNNVIFLDGAITEVNITSLTQDTMYNIRVEASTTKGSLINVGNIQVTTTTTIMETGGFPLAIVLRITAAVIVAVIMVIVGVVVVCCMKSRRSAKVPPANAGTNEPVYDVADDKEIYEDLQPATQPQKHVYQRRIEPTDVSSGEHRIEYEVSPSGMEYEVPKPGPEYLQLYNTAGPTTENPELMKTSEYMSLNKHTMDKDNVNRKYESLEVQSEYLELYNTVPIDNQDIKVPDYDLGENQSELSTKDITGNVSTI